MTYQDLKPPDLAVADPETLASDATAQTRRIPMTMHFSIASRVRRITFPSIAWQTNTRQVSRS